MNRSDRFLHIFSRIVISILTFASVFVISFPRDAIALAFPDRTFLNLSLEFLDEYELPKMTYEGTKVGGLSAITYDPKSYNADSHSFKMYALSDDSGYINPPRFYTLNVQLESPDHGKIGINKVTVEGVTFLKNEKGETFPPKFLNPEGIALSPRNSVFISSEGISDVGVKPLMLGEFDLKTGQIQESFPIPTRYLPDAEGDKQTGGIVNNLGFESLTLDRESFSPGGRDPFRLFTAVESPLVQDKDTREGRNRFLHYLIVDKDPQLVAEHFYPLDRVSSIFHGLTDLLALGKGGHFLSLERSFGLKGFQAKIFQVAIAGATDTSRVESLKGELNTVKPMAKKLLLDFNQLDIAIIDNLEGMTLGPRLADGSQSLILVSDDNFRPEQKNQFLLLRVKSNS
ncbi:MAG: esterase-like activity of phytase family protein [Microcoleaceae cyanobacterium]|jgi:hypothetical protein